MLVVKSRIEIALDWKSLTIYDETGYGVTGYGTNQDPVGARRASSAGTDIIGTRIILISPSNITYTFDLNASQAYTTVINGYTISNTDLGFTATDTLEDGIWTVKYCPLFANSGTINVTNNSTLVSFSNSIEQSFNGANVLKTNTSGTPVYYDVSAVSLAANTLTLSEAYAGSTNVAYNLYQIGYESTIYMPIVKSIQNCMEQKIAALPTSACPCKEKQLNTLVNYYMLYDAMFINAANGNSTKTEYIYDILTNYCSTSDCNCNE